MTAQEEPARADREEVERALRKASGHLKRAVQSMRDSAVTAKRATKADGTTTDADVQGLSDDIHLLYEELRDVYTRVSGMVADIELSERA